MMMVDAGFEIRRRREAAGLSLSELARLIMYDKGYLSKVESGYKPLSATLARLCDAALGADGQIMALTSGSVDSSPSAGGENDLVPDIEGFTHLGSMSGEALQASGDNETVVYGLWQLLSQYRELGRSVSPRLVLDALTAQTRAVDLLARAATSSSVAHQLFHVASRFAEYTGWMLQESGDVGNARRWTAYAGRLAASSDQPDLAEFCRIRDADLALTEHRLAEAIDLTGQIQLAPNVSSQVRAMAALVQARGYAQAGNAHACAAALDRAGELATAHDSQLVPIPLGFTGFADPLAAARGWAWHELGKVADAIAVLDTALPRARTTSRRTRTRLAVRTALAHADASDLNAAENLVQEVLGDAQAVDSAPIRADLRLLVNAFARRHPTKFSEVRHRLKTVVSVGRSS